METIDINADLGEGAGYDKGLMPLVSSCNIACGGHYGEEESMQTAVRLAQRHKVKIGAHPSFPDRDHFGRRFMTMTKGELTRAIIEQLLIFYAICEGEEAKVHHVKLHGALYHASAQDAATADAVIQALEATSLRPKLYVPFGSVLHRKAENLFPLEFEAFIDRRYQGDLSLVPRTSEEALITDPKIAWKQLFSMKMNGFVESITSEEIPIIATTYCIHGDNLNAVPLLKFIHSQLLKHNIRLA